MDINPGEITDILKREIKEYDREIDVAETGTVLSVGDGIARVFGLEQGMAGELVEFPGGMNGLVLNLEEDNVGIAVMGETTHVIEGDLVRRTESPSLTWVVSPMRATPTLSSSRFSTNP